MTKYFTAWTDYPTLSQQTKESYVPMFRKVLLISYDGDKYVTIKDGDDLQEVKSGYIYRTRRRVSFKHSTLVRNLSKTEY